MRADHLEELADETLGRPVCEPDAAAVTSHAAAEVRWLSTRRRRESPGPVASNGDSGIKARYVAERREIAARYAEWEII